MSDTMIVTVRDVPLRPGWIECDCCGTRFPPGTSEVTLPEHRCVEMQRRRREQEDDQ